MIASPFTAVPDRSLQWLEPSPPWLAPIPAALCAGTSVAPDAVPLVHVLSSQCTAPEVMAVRVGRYVPLFGTGPSRDEAVRALANVVRALGNDADPRAPEHALAMVVHPGAGRLPLLALTEAALAGSAPLAFCEVALGYVEVLGASDMLRERVAQDLAGPRPLSLEVALALGAGGGDLGTYREHYAALTSSPEAEAPALRVMRAWFDFVLARRFAGLDALRALAHETDLDEASRWLITSAELVAGDELARSHLAQHAETVLAPLAPLAPRLLSIVARELAELVHHPLALRFNHLRCAAARDHAAVSIRAWLSAAAESDVDEMLPEPLAATLGPEPTRAGRAAIEARNAAGEFLLDWFVSEREAREAIDLFARRALRIYHRLRGAQILARVERALRPASMSLEGEWDRIVWGAQVSR